MASIIPVDHTSIASSSSCPFSLRKGVVGVDSCGRHTVTWGTPKARMVCYPFSRANPEGNNDASASKSRSVPLTGEVETVSARLKLAEEVLKGGDGLACSYNPHANLSGSKPMHVFIHLDLRKLLLAFPRSNEGDGDWQNPLDGKAARDFANRLSLQCTPFALPPQASKVVDKSITQYFQKILKGAEWREQWVAFSKENFFDKWISEEFIPTYEAFSSLGSATALHFMIGMPLTEETQKLSSIWNIFFSPKASPQEKGGAFGLYKTVLRPLLLNQIREVTAGKNSGFEGETIIHHWLETGFADSVMEKMYPDLDPKDYCTKTYTEGNEEISYQEKIILDNLILIQLGSQENFGFINSEFIRRTCLDEDLRDSCYGNSALTEKAIKKILLEIPPAGHTRDLRWDTDIHFTNRNNEEHIYHLSAGDVVGVLSSFIRLDEVATGKPTTTNNAYGAGPHKCPGQVIANPWMVAIAQLLVDEYDIELENAETHLEPEYIPSFTMKYQVPLMVRIREK